MTLRTATLLTAALMLGLGAAPVVRAEDPPPAAAQKKTAQSEAGEPRATTRPADKGDKAERAADNRTDRVDLDTTTVTGNRELPKVMYVVPWKKADIGDFVGKPMNSLLDEVLAPVDRDVFRREVGYYQALHAQAGQNSAAPSPQAEK